MFPNYKGLFVKERDNWKDLGEVKAILYTEKKSGKQFTSQTLHPYCGNTVHVGSENGELFKFCPVCLIKLTPEEE